MNDDIGCLIFIALILIAGAITGLRVEVQVNSTDTQEEAVQEQPRGPHPYDSCCEARTCGEWGPSIPPFLLEKLDD